MWHRTETYAFVYFRKGNSTSLAPSVLSTALITQKQFAFFPLIRPRPALSGRHFPLLSFSFSLSCPVLFCPSIPSFLAHLHYVLLSFPHATLFAFVGSLLSSHACSIIASCPLALMVWIGAPTCFTSTAADLTQKGSRLMEGHVILRLFVEW